MSQFGASTDIQLIRDQIQNNLASALAQVSAAFPDGITSYTPSPEPIFLYEPTEVYQCPAFFLIAQGFQTQKSQMGQNFILDRYTISCSCVVEAFDRQVLALTTYRYQAALRQILDQTELQYLDTMSNPVVKIFIRVKGGEFSKSWSNSSDANSAGAGFRKEIALELEVEHAENFS